MNSRITSLNLGRQVLLCVIGRWQYRQTFWIDKTKGLIFCELDVCAIVLTLSIALRATLKELL
ncbi:hypothetical protein ACOXDM_000795 [Proteus mirabilis]|nr:hypothetical protein [Proteus mirabilis]